MPDGTTSFPGNLYVNGNINNVDRISANSFVYANGTSILSGITAGGTTYSNANVAAYLVTNPQAGTYSNANVASYLPTYSGNIAGNIVKNGRTWTFGTDGTLTLPSGAGFGLGDNGQLKTNDGTTVALDFRDTSGRGFYTNGDGYTLRSDGSNNWIFGTNGTLSTPGNVQVGSASAYGNISHINTISANAFVYANGVSILDGVGGADTGNIRFNGSTVYSSYEPDNIYIDTTGGDYTWTFGADGKLTVPQGGYIGAAGVKGDGTMITGGNGQIASLTSFFSSGMYSGCVTANPDGTLNITTYGDGTGVAGQWIFGSDGSTTFPDNQPVTISGNLTVGNLTVNGNTTIINTESYTVVDNIIQMANANPADTLDIGFVGHRTINSTLEHTGLIRDASAGLWKLFSNVTTQPGTTVDFTGVIYDDLQLDKLHADTIH
jgi:hypothetical protein